MTSIRLEVKVADFSFFKTLHPKNAPLEFPGTYWHVSYSLFRCLFFFELCFVFFKNKLTKKVNVTTLYQISGVLHSVFPFMFSLAPCTRSCEWFKRSLISCKKLLMFYIIMSTTFDVQGKLIPPASCLQYQILIKIKKSTKFNNMHHKFPGSLICSFKSRACDKEVNAITNFQNY